MADYPFKINITTKDGTKKSFYDADFATSSDTIVSASLMVTRINAMKSASSFIESIEAPSLTSTNYNNASEGIKFLSASVTNPNTGSIIFTDKETSDNDGLDHYEFYGSKVCSVLGLPEGIPIYTENFKLSDSSTDTTNYISGEFISDRVAIKRGFKMSPQARMQSNLIWDEAFGEGIIQWVSGSNTRLFIGYDDVANQYKIAGGAVTFNISGVDSISATEGAFTTLDDTNTIISSDSSDLKLVAGLSSYTSTTYTNGQLLLDRDSGNNIMNGKLRIHGSTTALFEDVDGLSQAGTVAHDGNGNLRSEYTLHIKNFNSDNAHNFAGISFDAGTEDDSDSLGASIAAVRDISANGTAGLHDHNLVFCTNDAGDDGLRERLVIFHDGEVRAKHTISSSAFQTDGNITVGGTVDGIDIAGSLDQAVKTTSSPTFSNLTVATSIIHSGDTDTDITFGSNTIGFDAANVSVLDLGSGTATFNEGAANVDVRMEAQSGQGGAFSKANLFHLDASLGIVCIGNGPQSTDASRLFQVTGNSATDIVRIFNDGNNANRSGMQIRIGTDNGSGTNEYIMFREGDETAIGLISATSGVVSYGTFTGVHNAGILESDSTSANVITGMPTSSQYHEYPQGTVVSMVSSSYDGSLQPVSFVVSSSAYQDKRTFGVYLGSHNWDDDQRSHAIDKHLIMSVGDGYVLVNNQNGNIETGDYITTASGSGGYGCKQSDDLLHNYTVAKACDSVDWSNESTTYKLLACTYHCG